VNFIGIISVISLNRNCHLAMKFYHKQLLLISFYSIILIVLSSCATMLVSPSTSFNNSNDIHNIKAKIILENNSSMLGYLTLKNKINQKAASVHLPKERKTIDLDVHTIKAYEIEDVHFALKLIEPFSSKIYLWGKPGAHKSFVKRLTPSHYQIQLYSYEEKVADVKSSLTKTVTHYFVEFNKSANEKIVDVMHSNFPSFYKQQIAILSNNCAAFSEGFAQQQKTLSINSSSKTAAERMKIVYHVASLYENCINSN
jgi:hypothetical protein